jgi:AcrR family transcriptional regulator
VTTDDRLLNATGRILAEVGWSQVTMAAVASAADVSRQTLYKRFGSRSELAQAYVLRESGRLVAVVDRALAANGDDPRTAITAAFDTFLRAAGEHPLVRAIVGEGEGADELLELFTIRGRSVLEAASSHLAGTIRATWPQLAPDVADLAAEIAVRLAISVAAQPEGPAHLDSAKLADAMVPFLERELAKS